MMYEYLFFNLLVLSGPFILGWLKPFYFLDRWPRVLVGTILVSIPYLIWDSLVTGLHWEFSYHYTTGLVLFNLPIEEFLFFFTVPAACLFTWEMITRRMDSRQVFMMRYIRMVFYFLPVAGIWIYFHGLHYTGLATIFFGLAMLLDSILKTDLFMQKRFLFFFILAMIFTLLFNGYLAWRPVVVYNEIYMTGWRFFTIPVEDFWYGFSLIYFNTIVYQKLPAMGAIQHALRRPVVNRV